MIIFKNTDHTVLLKAAVLWLIVVPICLLWDVIFLVIENIYKGAVWIDNHGDNTVENIRRWSERK